MSWDEYYKLAKKYYKKYGNLLIPRKYVMNDVKIGSWLNNQRYYYKNNTLSIDRIKKLESIGMVWCDVHQARFEENWNDYYELAKAFYLENNHIFVSQKYDLDLCRWLNVQRQLCFENKLSEEKINKLNEIGMTWNKRKIVNNIPEEKYYTLAQEYFKIHNNLSVPPRYIVEGVNLGFWVNLQRRKYDKNELTEEKIKKLEEIGMQFNGLKSYEDRWDEYYNGAREYYKEHENLNIPYNYNVNGLYIGRWINNQRLMYKKNMMSRERFKKLDSLGMVWDTNKIRLKIKLDKEKNENNIPLLIENILNTCCIYSIETLSYYFCSEHKIDADSINEKLRSNLPRHSYEIFILYVYGINTNLLSKLYGMDKHRIEMNRLLAFKEFVKIIDVEKHKELVK